MSATEPVGLLFDMTRCSGCRQCVGACMDENKLKGDPKTVTDLSGDARTCVREEKEVNVRNLCRHCVAPSCASVCPVGAFKKTDLGPVTYDADKCIGCRYCMVACPFNIPRYEWNEPVPRVQKCDMCFARIEKGGIPACAAACRQDATVFGTRKELLAEAHRRIEESPEDYYDHVYGEKEIGGTSVLFLAPSPFESLGYAPELGTEPLPALTTIVPKRVPAIALCGGAALMAFWWITRRRDEVTLAEEAAARAAHDRARHGRGEEHSHD